MEIINIKEDYPTSDVAVAEVEILIDAYNSVKTHALIKVIHGHGSHGVGGTIRLALRKRLKELQKKHKIRTFIKGEAFSHDNLKNANPTQQEYEILIADEDYQRLNSGVTIIFI